MYLPQKTKNGHKETLGDGGICLLPWLWWWYNGCTQMFKLIKLHTLNMCSFCVSYFNKAVKNIYRSNCSQATTPVFLKCILKIIFFHLFSKRNNIFHFILRDSWDLLFHPIIRNLSQLWYWVGLFRRLIGEEEELLAKITNCKWVPLGCFLTIVETVC